MVTIIGNLTRDPELRYSEQGTAVANLTVAVSRRRRERNGTWTDQLDGCFDVVAFQGVAEHAAEGLHKGDRVLVAGRLRQETYTDRNGSRRQAVKIVAEEIAPTLRFTAVDAAKTAGR